MRLVAPYTKRTFARAIAMPNLSPPVSNLQQCLTYKQRLSTATDLQMLMTLYLTDQTTSQMITEAKPDTNAYGEVFGAKLYPRGTTTHSSLGVSDPLKLIPVFETMAEQQLPLLIHGETADETVDIYDRENVFTDQVFIPLRERVPTLKIIFEHITTATTVQAVLNYANTAATITPHHLYYTRSALFENGLRPHRYCLPLAKREHDRQALIAIASSGNPQFFAGTDSAPHTIDSKHSDCGCAGIFNAPCALETYAEIFEQMEALDKLEAFTALNGAGFYNIPTNTKKITLVKEPWKMPKTISDNTHTIVPFRADETINWQVPKNTHA